MKPIKRKPDFENESARMWIPTKKEESEWKKELKETEIKVDLGGGQKIGLWGFTRVENNGKLMVAYKIKAENQQVLYHIPKDLDEQDKQIVDKSLEDLKKIIPFTFQDVTEVAKGIMKNEGNTIDRLTEMKKKGEKNEIREDEEDN